MSSPSNTINLVYIRAAIRANTGVSLSLPEVRRYLLEEGLITRKQARSEATVFRGYSKFYSSAPFTDDRPRDGTWEEFDLNL